jgi:UDP-glucose:(heptosyl)LPS alpha-1,3-glucosyltransferase
VALEAMASGLAVVTSTKCGAAELIRPGENGFVVDSQDIDGLAQSLRLLLDPERPRNMGAVARATVEPMHLDKMSQELVNLYQELI